MVGDSINKDDNDVMAGDIVTVCQPAQQKRALPGLRSCLGSSSREKRVPKDWCIHLALSLILLLYSHIQIFCVSLYKEGNILICSADFISLLLPGMEALCQCMQDIRWFGSPLQIFDAI